VTIGDDPAWTFTAAFVDPERWNGWACPWFTEAEGRKIAAVTQAEYQRAPEATQEYIGVDEAADPASRFRLVVPDERESWTVDSANFDGVWVYAIGSGNWTWEEAR
jgi:hypothetical protein